MPSRDAKSHGTDVPWNGDEEDWPRARDMYHAILRDEFGSDIADTIAGERLGYCHCQGGMRMLVRILCGTATSIPVASALLPPIGHWNQLFYSKSPGKWRSRAFQRAILR